MRYPPTEKEDQIERWYILDTKVLLIIKTLDIIFLIHLGRN